MIIYISNHFSHSNSQIKKKIQDFVEYVTILICPHKRKANKLKFDEAMATFFNLSVRKIFINKFLKKCCGIIFKITNFQSSEVIIYRKETYNYYYYISLTIDNRSLKMC